MGSDGGALMVDPEVTFQNYVVPQGISADLIATKYGISRDDADAYAVESHKRASRSWEEGRFDKLSRAGQGHHRHRPAQPRRDDPSGHGHAEPGQR